MSQKQKYSKLGDSQKDFAQDSEFNEGEQLKKLSTKQRLLASESFKDGLEILRLASPVLLANIANFGLGVTDNIFLGHLGSEAFAASALGTTWSFCTLFISMGIQFGMDTLVSQAFGAQNYKLVGIILQNVLFLSTITAIPVAFLWYITADVMRLIGQPESIATKAGLFCRYLIPGLLPSLYYSVAQRYLQNQGIVTPALIVGIIGFLANIFLNYLYIWVFGWGVIGSAMATTTSRFLLMILLWGFIYVRKLHVKTWYGWSKEMWSWKRISNYLRFGIGSGLMILFEVWGFESTTVTVGILAAKEPKIINSHSVGFNSLLISFAFPLALSIGTSTRIGHLLGEGNPSQAKRAGKIGVAMVTIIMIVNSSVIFLFRKQFGKLYTNDTEVISLVGKILQLAALATVLDAFQVTLGGIMRGSGTPKAGTIMNFIGYYLVGIPLYIFLGYYLGMGVYGVWLGLIVGLFVICAGSVFFVLRIDWEKESKLAQVRSEKPAENENVELEPMIHSTSDDVSSSNSSVVFTIADDDDVSEIENNLSSTVQSSEP